jgi:hypothetical protein
VTTPVVDTALRYRLPLKEDFAKRINIAAELFQMPPTIGGQRDVPGSLELGQREWRATPIEY